MKTFFREFEFDGCGTCKVHWKFTLSDGQDGVLIEDLEIIGGRNDGKELGCLGHPQTIVALICGLPISSIDIVALKEAGCSRSLSCGQVLARCLEQLQAETSTT